MEHRGARLINHPVTALPQAHAIVGFFVISRLEAFVEAAELFPERARREQKGARTVIHVATEHVRRREGRVAAAVSETRAVPPHDAACFLQRAVEQNDLAPYGADVRSAA